MGVIARQFAAVLLLVSLSGCFAPVSPMQRVSDAARDLNVATRFSKMDLVATHVDGSFRSDFISRRQLWGKELRLVDIELAGVQIEDNTHARVMIDVSWVPLSDGILRSTRVEQRWQDDGHGWKLVNEQRKTGDTGLFGEVIVPANEPHPDVHLPSRTLGSHNGA